ncbi:MFS transporter [Caldibacillus lycopersici]|uniref:MFS transporter n=1 Tax=Perspicuibacillus lycopersici TaxID=1325689 RepID=A0AAE3LS54_9BACI|nr:MFS transporter [Perspicuibacillus lycopersici]MCU9612388.1 MFS transporter [Perspicuibacillus lycopersici]
MGSQLANQKILAVNTPDFYPRALYTFSGSHFLNDLVTTGMVPALVVMYKDAFELNYTQSTMIVLVSYLTSSIMQPLFGMLADKKPRVWLFSLGVFLSITGLALTALAPSLPWLLVFIAMSGLGSGIFHPEASRGTHFASGQKKALAQAIFQVGGNAGQAIGPLMIPLFLVYSGIEGLIWLLPVAFLSFFLTVPLLKWLNERVQINRGPIKSITGENHISGATLLVLVIILRSWCQVGVVVFLPFYFSNLSLEQAEILNFVFVGAGALGTLLGGILSDQLGMKRLLVISMTIATPFALLFPHLHGFLAIVDLLLFGLTVLASFSITVVYMQRLLPKNIGLASGLTIGIGVGAGGIGSVFMGSISDIFGVSMVFTMLSLLPLLGAILSAFLPNEKELVK